MNEVAITGIARTPIGAMLGKLSDFSTSQLGAVAIKSALMQAGVSAQQVDEVLMGCVLGAGVGMAPARQAALLAGLNETVPCLTLNKVCGSGMKAIMLATEAIQIGRLKTVVAGGMESMSNAPYLAPKARKGYRLGDAKLLDHIYIDGLQAPCSDELMGTQAQNMADTKHLTREELDKFAIGSLQRAKKAIASGALTNEIAPIEHKTGTIETDELPLKFDEQKIPHLKPAFKQNGTITAATASSIADGAAALILQCADAVNSDGDALPYIVAQATVATAPAQFTYAPVEAIKQVVNTADWTLADVELYEINEAFASVPLFAIKELKIERDKLNINGGACAIGHPLGCSGARIVVTLVNAMRQRNAKRGVAAICIGGGEATALAVEIR